MQKSRSFIMFGLTTLVLVAVIGYSWFLNQTVVVATSGIVYDLEPGTGKRSFVQGLERFDLVSAPWAYKFFIYVQPMKHLKAGEYYFPPGSSLYSIWKQVTQGKGFFNHPFTIVPGWSFKQLQVALNKAPSLKHVTTKMNNEQIMLHLGVANVSPEGVFFPETYFYTKGTPDLVILQEAYDLMQKRIQEAWPTRSKDIPFTTPYEALIAASLVEKEAYLSSEKPIIAGVLVNRLKSGMLLQFDPTVIYGMGDAYKGEIHKEDLLADNPYNTYVHKGLPPTPIAIPDYLALQAVLHPAVHHFYYFVTKGHGEHQFSETLEQHNVAVQHLLETEPKPGFYNSAKVKALSQQILPPLKVGN